jgi:aldehyde dehydrogenase (NAD+)
VAATAFTFKYYAGWADKFTSKFIPTQNQEIAYTRNEPYGLTAGIIPWVNYFSI